MSTVPSHHLAEAPLPEPERWYGRRELLAVRVLQAGAVAVVLAAATNRFYELDRFYVPKELALHLTALLAGLLALPAVRRLRFTLVDGLLLGFLALGFLSAAFATNWWLAGRALAVTASGIVLFWTARGLAQAGLARPIIAALALAVVLTAATALLQTYGLRTDLFSTNRAPGGTLGNRNSVAHVAALGFPLVLLGALAAPRFARYLLASLGSALVVAVLILTRSRAGWLAFAAALVLVLAGVLLARPLRTHGRTWARLFGILLLAGGAVAGAVAMPNSLRWNSDNPYLESMRSVANFQEGSGRGRMVQYRQSLRMTLRHPLLGVGPGNWAVAYPEHAASNDRSLSRANPGMTSNPWPSSDWIAYVAERGPAAALLLSAAFLLIALAALARLLSAYQPDAALRDLALVALLAAAAIAGTFDAVLLLAIPTFIVWTAAGALSGRPADEYEPRRGRGFLAAALLVTLLAGAGAVRSGAQLTAMTVHGSSNRLVWLRTASRIDPGNYRLHLQLARRGSGLGRAARCEHALAARALYPSSGSARSLGRGCK